MQTQLVNDPLIQKIRDAYNLNDVEVGEILYTSWGYDQTNIDFYKVVARRGTAVDLVEIGTKQIECNDYGAMGGKCVPNEEFQGKTFKKRIFAKRGSIKMESYAHLRRWDGKPQYNSWGH